MAEFKKALSEFLGDGLILKLETDNWLDLLTYLAERIDDLLLYP